MGCVGRNTSYQDFLEIKKRVAARMGCVGRNETNASSLDLEIEVAARMGCVGRNERIVSPAQCRDRRSPCGLRG